MRFTDLLFQTLLEEVKNKKLFNRLMDIWKTEKPNITDEEGEELYTAFARIQDGLRLDRPQVYTFLNRYDGLHGYSKFDPNNIKQIDKYTYSQLIFLLNEFSVDTKEIEKDVFTGADTRPTPEKIQASQNLWNGNNNLVFQKDGLRVYAINNQQEAVRFSYYYHTIYAKQLGIPETLDDGTPYYKNRNFFPWCVTWRPDTYNRSNQWGTYRQQGRTFYFVIDENKNESDKYHMAALQRDPAVPGGYRVTDMRNGGDIVKTWDEVVEIYPQLSGEKNIIENKPFSSDELYIKDIVGQINEREGNQYEFKRMDKSYKKAYIDNGGTLSKPESWRSMDEELRNLYIIYPSVNQYNVKERYGNFDFLSEIKKVGNQFTLLDRTLKNKGIGDGVGSIVDFLMSNEFKIARVSGDNKKIRLYESKINGKSGLFNVTTNTWVTKNGVTYDARYSHIDTEVYLDSEGNTYVVDVYSTSAQPTDDSFYSVYNIGDENPNYDAHFLSSNQFKLLMRELSPEDGGEPETDKPSEYSDIKEKRGY
jgi:hypothetical protein